MPVYVYRARIAITSLNSASPLATMHCASARSAAKNPAQALQHVGVTFKGSGFYSTDKGNS